MAAKGIPCVVTVDFDVTNPSRFDDNRAGTRALLEVADRFDVPITWGVCGNAAEQDMRSYNAILNANTRHEIGVHTYSHVDASVASKDEFRADIERCITSLGLDSPRSFIFPWNRENHFDVLDELGFRAFRGKKRAIGPPVPKEGLWNFRPVYYVDQKSLGADSLIRSYIDLCVRHKGVFHLWTHPWSLMVSGKAGLMMETISAVFGHIANLRQEGRLTPSTMAEVAARLDRGPLGTRPTTSDAPLQPESRIPG